jgi:hypothetical protein
MLFPAYSEHNPTKHLKPPKLVEFVSSNKIMHRNIFIPTLFTEMLVVDVVINDHQQRADVPFRIAESKYCVEQIGVMVEFYVTFKY